MEREASPSIVRRVMLEFVAEQKWGFRRPGRKYAGEKKGGGRRKGGKIRVSGGNYGAFRRWRMARCRHILGSNFRFPDSTLPFLRIPGPLKIIGRDRDGNANLLSGLLDPDDLPPAFHAHKSFRINVFQYNREIYGLALSKRFLCLKKNSCAAEIAGDALAIFKLYGRCIPVSSCPLFFGFFHEPYPSSRL
jgi:hypothetical protein